MDWFAKAFIKAALVWLGLGVTLGVVMAVSPAAAVYRTAHLHMNLLGFVSMMIYGVAYHVIPRFTGNENARGSPSFASASIAAPPGYGNPRSRAPLSNASPAASSTVWPSSR